MSQSTDWTEGQTAPEEFVIKAGTSVSSLTPVDLSGLTVGLLLKDRTGATVTTTGDVTVITPASGLVKFSPDSTDLLASLSPYTARFQVTYGDASVRYFPQGPAMQWKVFAP